MNLRKAVSILILGLAYMILNKAALAVFPALAWSRLGSGIATGLWLLAALTFVLFAGCFLLEIRPRHRLLRFSLFAIIFFTLMVVVSKLPVWPLAGAVGRRLFLGFSSLLNGLAVLAFLLSLFAPAGRDSPLRAPLRAAIGGCGLMVALRVTSTAYLLAFLLTGRMVEPPALLLPLSMLSFIFAYGAVIWFLIRFRRVEDYSVFAAG